MRLADGEKLTFRDHKNRGYWGSVLGVHEDDHWIIVPDLEKVVQVHSTRIIVINENHVLASHQDRERSFDKLIATSFLDQDNFMIEAGKEKRIDMVKIVKMYKLISP